MSDLPMNLFLHCPRCGARRAETGTNPLRCTHCHWTYYFNPTCAVGVFLFDESDRVLWIRRAKEPRQGTLAIPGGFIDHGEPAEIALSREVREEIGIELGPVRFLGSHPNLYHYAGVTYPVVDFLFTGRVGTTSDVQPLDGVAAIEWKGLNDISDDDIAFPSIRRGRELLQATSIGT